ncbi:MAG: hypothetical protein QOE76_3177 [Frankiales bacterium]|nr:hypothetical protein [Frankiales bacterium]
MIGPEDELGVMLHVSVSDVQPQVDHASRALAARHRHVITWTSATTGFLVGVLVVTFAAVSSRSRQQTPAQLLAGQRWQHAVHLDGNRLLIEPPGAGDTVSLTRDETLALLQSTHSGTALSVVTARWGRVSVRDARGVVVTGFDRQPAWAVVFRIKDDTTTCPTTSAPVEQGPDPGDYTGVQVFVVAATDARLLYSQSGSWSCGLPAAPVAQLPEDPS